MQQFYQRIFLRRKVTISFSLQENDYIDSYFDNGEDFAADSDDNMDGEATY